MELKVSANSKPASVAGSIASQFNTGANSVDIQCIGAGSLNQAVKAIIIARGYTAPSGISLTCVPSFCTLIVDGEEKTGIRINVNRVY